MYTAIALPFGSHTARCRYPFRPPADHCAAL